MTRIRLLLSGLLAVFALSAVAASAASADVYEWHVKGLPLVGSKNITSTGGPFTLEGKVGTVAVEIECKKQGLTGTKNNIKAGNPGTDEAEITFTECKLIGAAKCKITVGTAKVKSEIVEIITKENEDLKTKETGLNLVGILFTPTGTNFTTITSEGAECAIKFKEQAVTGSTVAGVSPEEQEAVTNKLIWKDSNPVVEYETFQDVKKTTGLTFAGNAAELVGESNVTLESKEEFGAFGPAQ
jgi:hypothetical protein